MTRMPEPFGLYIHWPFCKSKCPYCDFNSHVHQSFDEQAWAEAIIAQLQHAHTWVAGRPLTSVFFGGGTPSLLTPKTVGLILDQIHRLWPLSSVAEITLEANPTSLEAQHLPGYRAAGVNRLSLGVQALRDEDLAFLGRQHTAGEACQAIAMAQTHFENFSFDLIYARPHQTAAAWETELRQALTYGSPHLSVYQLTIEPGTAFYTQHQRGELEVPGEEEAAELYDLTQEILTAAGMPAYEVSNHARPGFECQHNMLYWQYHDYVGVGPGAHGRVTLEGVKQATVQSKAPAPWMQAVHSGKLAPEKTEAVTGVTLHEEFLLMGLRLVQGFSLDHYRSVTGVSLTDQIPASKWQALVQEGLLIATDTTWRLTSLGLKKANAVWRYLSSS